MMHKLRSVMGTRNDEYKLKHMVELDEGFFTCNDEMKSDAGRCGDRHREDGRLSSGLGSERKAKVEVMAESKETKPMKRGQKSRAAGHIKMKAMKDLKASTINGIVGKGIDPSAGIIADAYPSHSQLDKVADKVDIKVVKPKDAPKVLPWVHVAIANAKSLFWDMYHGIKEEFLQEYLNRFCYKFNRRFFGDRVFDRLIIAAASYRPTFEHRRYGSKDSVEGG